MLWYLMLIKILHQNWSFIKILPNKYDIRLTSSTVVYYTATTSYKQKTKTSSQINSFVSSNDMIQHIYDT